MGEAGKTRCTYYDFSIYFTLLFYVKLRIIQDSTSVIELTISTVSFQSDGDENVNNVHGPVFLSI